MMNYDLLISYGLFCIKSIIRVTVIRVTKKITILSTKMLKKCKISTIKIYMIVVLSELIIPYLDIEEFIEISQRSVKKYWDKILPFENIVVSQYKLILILN